MKNKTNINIRAISTRLNSSEIEILDRLKNHLKVSQSDAIRHLICLAGAGDLQVDGEPILPKPEQSFDQSKGG